MPPTEHSTIKPAATRALMALAAALVLLLGVFLARRTVSERLPSDRQLLREVGAELHGRLLELDQQFLTHLREVAEIAFGNHSAGANRANELRSLAAVGVFPQERGSKYVVTKLQTFGESPPDLLLGETGEDRGPFKFLVPRARVFSGAAEGWFAPPKSDYMAWWSFYVDGTACVILISKKELAAVDSEELTRILPQAWAPARAAGGLDQLLDPAGKCLSGKRARSGPPDFVLTLPCFAGSFQVESHDRWEQKTEWQAMPILLTGVLALALLMLGFRVADQQRRALREASSRVSFVNQVSHELGTPLTNLRLNLELAADLLPEGAEAAKTRLDIVHDESLRLSWLVENVLQRARQERGALQLHPTLENPAETVRTAVEKFLPLLERRGFTVETALPPEISSVLLDHRALSQIVTNLLSNVEKYAAPGRWARVSLTAQHQQLTLRVADRGPGIRPTDASRIFQPFVRLQSGLTEGASGTGLGLAIVRELAESMGGHAVLQNAGTGAGAIFAVTLPIRTTFPKQASP